MEGAVYNYFAGPIPGRFMRSSPVAPFLIGDSQQPSQQMGQARATTPIEGKATVVSPLINNPPPLTIGICNMGGHAEAYLIEQKTAHVTPFLGVLIRP